jgi:hypothetical protein
MDEVWYLVDSSFCLQREYDHEIVRELLDTLEIDCFVDGEREREREREKGGEREKGRERQKKVLHIILSHTDDLSTWSSTQEKAQEEVKKILYQRYLERKRKRKREREHGKSIVYLSHSLLQSIEAMQRLLTTEEVTVLEQLYKDSIDIQCTSCLALYRNSQEGDLNRWRERLWIHSDRMQRMWKEMEREMKETEEKMDTWLATTAMQQKK